AGYEDPEGAPVRAVTLYFGGGTPSRMAPDQIGRIVDAAAGRFGLPRDAEITLEANPGDLAAERLAGYRLAGVNRVSLGVQSFRDPMLRFLERRHTAAEARAAYDRVRAAGFENVSVDLIYGLPGQSAFEWEEDLRELRRWAPEHASLYALSMEEGSALTARWRAGEVDVPEEDVSAALWDALGALSADYEHYEISNFARPGRRAAHNSLYWRWSPYVGFGAAAHSFVPLGDGGLRWSNLAEPARFMEAALAGRAARARRERLDRETAVAEYLLTRLRLSEGFSEDDFALRFGARFEALVGPALGEWAEAGYLRRWGGRVLATPRGWLLSNALFGDVVSRSVRALTTSRPPFYFTP
ncbi:MAG: coproporphyrinogen III oxidase family protein, partial [Candidatus Methylomirabilis sp.]|nr:coproporphyrinogen III oxidase family protein [Deltaproteobacteria bacterium]